MSEVLSLDLHHLSAASLSHAYISQTSGSLGYIAVDTEHATLWWDSFEAFEAWVDRLVELVVIERDKRAALEMHREAVAT